MDVANVVRQRASLNGAIRRFFQTRDFVEVETPHLVAAAGTDLYLDPIPATLQTLRGAEPRWLHTSPEFAMKELLVEGLERIYQLCHVWRDGESTPQHNPEFTILEWYRAHAGYERIIDDVEELVAEQLGPRVEIEIPGYVGEAEIERPFERVTMRDLWLDACGIDPIATAGSLERLHDAAQGAGREPRRRFQRWDELFFYLWFEAIEPWLRDRGPVFVTEWPAELAVLAQRCPHDARVAERFELYVGGVELANGFGELTDPVEQRARFLADNEERIAAGKQVQPMPERFLAALERGMPPSAGVALGVDRLLMLKLGVGQISAVLPFAES